MMNKVCKNCRETKPATDDYFPTKPNGKLLPSCRICRNERKGYKVCTKCGTEKLANRDNFGSTPRGGFRGSCRKCMATAANKHNKENPEMLKNRIKKRRQQDKGFTVSPELRVKLYQRDKGYCLLCRKLLGDWKTAHVDHLTPVSRGGHPDHPNNLCLAHVQCNKEKHNKTYVEHWEWRRKNNIA